MTSFDPARYPAPVAALFPPDRLPELGPGRPNGAARTALANLRLEDLGPHVHNVEAARACLSGLWLFHDFLDESHRISQDLDTPEGSFWHAIMHRREPDAANSKYWWRRVGSHPVLRELAEQAPAVGGTYRDPFTFVDLCERVRGTGTAGEESARRVQLLEWQLLFDHGCRLAVAER